jgi:putative two-component system response regulator
MTCRPASVLHSAPDRAPGAKDSPPLEFGHFDETDGILFALAQAVEQRDRHTAGHCERLALISVTLGAALRLSQEELLVLYRGGYLHDIGKVGIPDSILFKPGKLTPGEWEVMRSHPVRGEEICRPLRMLDPVRHVIRSHHERWDGSGYPDGLAGTQIPLLARVLQAADIYDALTSPRPYKSALTPRRALSVMVAETERGWRDPEIMQLFFRVHRRVISRVAAYREDTSHSMQDSMRNLQTLLSRDGSGVSPAGNL